MVTDEETTGVIRNHRREVMRWSVKIGQDVNWNLKMKFFVLPDRPTPHYIMKRGSTQIWVRGVRVSGRLLPVVTWMDDKKNLVIEIPGYDPSEISTIEKEEIENKLMAFFGLRDVEKLYRFMEKDEILRDLKEKYSGFGRAGLMSFTVFEGVIKAIIQQQISFLVAEKITARLVERYGSKVEGENVIAYDFPTPEQIAQLRIEDLRNCGLSQRKAECVITISKDVENGLDLENLRNMNEDEVLEILTSFKGVGRWTAELVMAGVLGFNVIPADDLGIRRAISNIFFNGDLQDAKTVRDFALSRFGEFTRDIVFYLFLVDRLAR